MGRGPEVEGAGRAREEHFEGVLMWYARVPALHSECDHYLLLPMYQEKNFKEQLY